ncbi:MAG TPA: hypothetical protein DCY13_05560 [Verrucomicrobiales bacterium]|nr:hypothetical protein [Verrucomicrobiales bacterium]
MNENAQIVPCPKCGAPLPIPDAVVCPGCDAILRPDPELAPARLEQEQQMRWIILLGMAAAIYLLMTLMLGARSPQGRLLALIPTGIYLLAFYACARRIRRPLALALLSLVVWLGFCALATAIFFVGCLIMVSRRGFVG